MPDNHLFNFANGRYFKWACFLSLASILAYCLDTPEIKPNGGTWLGYTLGTIAALLIVWLMLFGIRKRAYASNLGTVRGWLSAHVYLGLSLLIIATLHTGFEFSWNVHTLAYTLMVLVIASGVWGVILYFRNPSLMNRQIQGQTLEEMVKNLRDIDQQCHNIILQTSASYLTHLVENSKNVLIFNASWQKLTGTNLKCTTAATVKTLGQDPKISQSGAVQDIYLLQIKKQQILKRLRHYIKLRTYIELWLLFHVPLSFALLASLMAHIISVFFYW